jgi:hypothetical protein
MQREQRKDRYVPRNRAGGITVAGYDAEARQIRNEEVCDRDDEEQCPGGAEKSREVRGLARVSAHGRIL